MARGPRHAPGGMVYHACNRGVGRREIFHKEADYAAFERILLEARQRWAMRIVCYCLMPNHWHMILWPAGDGELSGFVQWLTNTHTQRYHAHYHTAGTGHIYQGRFKSFPVASDPHLLIVNRYAERNALRAGLVQRAEQWRWSSLWRREHEEDSPLLSDWPVDRPADWTAFVNEAQTPGELAALRQCVKRGCPFGPDDWRDQTARRLDLLPSLRPQGRPPKATAKETEPMYRRNRCLTP